MDFSLSCAIVIGPKQVNYVLLRRKGIDNILVGAAFYDFSEYKVEEFESILASIDSFVPADVLTNMCFIHPDVIEHVFFYDTSIVNVKVNAYRDLKSSYEIELKDYLIDHEEFSVGDKKAALVCAIPNILFENYYKIFKKHKKFKLFSVETPIVSLRRLIVEFGKSIDSVLCFGMCDDFSRIFSLNNYNVVVNRQVQTGFLDVIKDLKEEGGITEKEAEELLRKQGLKDDDLEDEQKKAFYNTLTNSFDRFSIEIQRTIDYLMSVQKVGGIDSIYTLGFANRIAGIDSYLSRMFSMRVDKLEVQKAVEFGDDIDFSLVEKMIYFDVCVGAALRRVK